MFKLEGTSCPHMREVETVDETSLVSVTSAVLTPALSEARLARGAGAASGGVASVQSCAGHRFAIVVLQVQSKEL